MKNHPLNIGVIYRGQGDHELLEEWSKRCAMNLGGHSLGIVSLDETGKEMPSCM